MVITDKEVQEQYKLSDVELLELFTSGVLASAKRVSGWEADSEEVEKYFKKSEIVNINVTELVYRAKERAVSLSLEFYNDSFKQSEVLEQIEDKHKSIELVKRLNDFRYRLKYFKRLEKTLNFLLDGQKANHKRLKEVYYSEVDPVITAIAESIDCYKVLVITKWESVDPNQEFTLAELLGVEP